MPIRKIGEKDGVTVYSLDVGDKVYCDYCGVDYTDRPDEGGILFQSKAVCPECTKETLKTVKKYNEERFIRGECPEGVSFANWVRSIR